MFSGREWLKAHLRVFLKPIKADIEANRLPPRENQGGSFLVLNQDQTLEWIKPVTIIVPGHIRNVHSQIFSSGGGQ
jgi:hypothetical protein